MKHPFEIIMSKHQQGFRQQHECLCGPASLSLVSEAMGLGTISEETWVSPKWKKWMPCEDFLVRGLALHELLFMAEVTLGQQVEITLSRAYPENKEKFLDDLREASTCNDYGLILNFAQDHLMGRPFDDQGYPHYSPVGAYVVKAQEILVADIDREIPRAYKVSVDRAFQGMTFTNPAFGVPRGWLKLRRR